MAQGALELADRPSAGDRGKEIEIDRTRRAVAASILAGGVLFGTAGAAAAMLACIRVATSADVSLGETRTALTADATVAIGDPMTPIGRTSVDSTATIDHQATERA